MKNLLMTLLCCAPLWAGDNILLIIADDLGVDNVGAYGENTAAANTPNIDALAESGLLFRNAWSNPVCSPTRAGIFTGRHAFRTGVGNVVKGNSTAVMSLDEFTLAEALAQGGYQSALIGKWHVGNDLNGGAFGFNEAGWSYYAGLLSGALSDYYLWPRTEQGVTEYIEQYATTAQVDDALAWIANQTEPWLCILAFTAPHTPFHEPPAELHTVDLTGLDPDSNPLPFYKAAVEAMDTEIGRLLEGLGSQSAQTNIIFIGDNGTPGQVVEEPLSSDKAKGTAYEGGINVPLIVHGPAVVSPGREIKALAVTVDLYATIVSLAGLDLTAVLPAGTVLDSVDLSSMIGGQGQINSRFVYTEMFDDQNSLSAVRGWRYKLLRDNGQEYMFDLFDDSAEETNLLDGTLDVKQERAYQALKAVLDDPSTLAAVATSAP